MHRTGNGNVVARTPEQLAAARVKWFAENRTVHTYCSQEEWDAYPDDFGEVVATNACGAEFRVHATVRTHRPTQQVFQITHNCILVGRLMESGSWWGYAWFSMSERVAQEAIFTGLAALPQDSESETSE